MDALRFSFKDKSLDLIRTEVPEIKNPTEVLIRVAFAGVCGSDLHILEGEFPDTQTSSVILGHEFSGTVVEVGYNVLNLVEGDKVSVDPNAGCQRCSFCHAGKPHFCKMGCTTNTIGIYKNGGWATYVICPEEQIYKLPKKITLEHAVLTEPISSIAHGWDLLAPICIGAQILIFACGLTGMLWTAVFHLQGHRNVVVVENSAERQVNLKLMNVGYSVVSGEQLRKRQEEDPSKYTFDVVIDCSGTAAAIEFGFDLLNSGGKLCLFGVSPRRTKISISPYDIFWKEIKIFGVNTNPYTFPKSLGLLEAMATRYLSFNTMGIKTFSLTQYKEAIELMKRGNITKAVFKM